MSGIIGPITAGRIAFALGTVGVGALIGGAVADHRDGNVAQGALIGGASALAGLAILYGGAAAWNHFSAGRAGAAAGVSTLGSTLSHTATMPVAPALTSLTPSLTSAATHVAPTATATATTAATTAATTTASTGWRAWVNSLFHEASAVSTLRPLPVAVPAIASTPMLPAATAASGSTFLNTMSQFLPR
jgi:hypothetical protein